MKPGDLQQQIIRRMEEMGLNQRSLALRAGLHEDAVRNILRGRSKHPRIDTMEKITQVLWGAGVSVPSYGMLAEPGAVPPLKKKSPAAALPLEEGESLVIDADMLMEATLLVKEVYGTKTVTPQDVKDLAVAVCRLAVHSGTHVINRTLVTYLLEAQEENDRRRTDRESLQKD